jgi:AhpD family alkylhydroperoxidase
MHFYQSFLATVLSERLTSIALAIGVSSRCDACIGFHVKALIRLGVSRAQLMETLAVCTYMGGGPTLMYAAEAVRAYEELSVGKATPASA